ncbi:MAG: WYL domain-containing protein [Burkholderiaceae bacterium]
MRSSRLLSLLLLLQLRGRTSAAALAREFEVSVRTVLRDVDALSAAGVPVYAERGRHGGIALHGGFQTRLTGLTAAEARALPLAGLAAAAKDLGFGADANLARRKLMASLPLDEGAGAQQVAERFHLDPLPWYHPAEAPDCLPRLADAVWRERRVRLDYEGWDGGRRRELSPLGLVLKGGLWYLVASADGRPRTYRVSSIRGLDVLGTGFRRPRRFDLASHWAASVADFEARLMAATATVRLSAEGQRILRAVSPLVAARADATQRPDTTPGWVVAEIPIESAEYSARQLLRLGTEAEVLSPPAVRAAVAHEAAQVSALYQAAVRAAPRRAGGRPTRA